MACNVLVGLSSSLQEPCSRVSGREIIHLVLEDYGCFVVGVGDLNPWSIHWKTKEREGKDSQVIQF